MRLSVKNGTKIDTVVKKIKKMLENEYKDGILTSGINIYIGSDTCNVYDCEIQNNIQEAYAYARGKFRNEMLTFFENHLNLDLAKEIEKYNTKYRKHLEQGQTMLAMKYKELLEDTKKMQEQIPRFIKQIQMFCCSGRNRSARKSLAAFSAVIRQISGSVKPFSRAMTAAVSGSMVLSQRLPR